MNIFVGVLVFMAIIYLAPVQLVLGERPITDEMRQRVEKHILKQNKAAYSDPSRPLIPTQVGHPFRRNAATDSEAKPATFPSPLGIGGRHPSDFWAG